MGVLLSGRVQIIGLGIGLVIGVDVGIDAGGVVNIFCNCSLDIFSYTSTFLSLSIFLNSSVLRFDKFDIMLAQKKPLIVGIFFIIKGRTPSTS